MLSRKCSSHEPSPKHWGLFQHYRSESVTTFATGGGRTCFDSGRHGGYCGGVARWRAHPSYSHGEPLIATLTVNAASA
jgi:hypothetical protein